MMHNKKDMYFAFYNGNSYADHIDAVKRGGLYKQTDSLTTGLTPLLDTANALQACVKCFGQDIEYVVTNGDEDMFVGDLDQVEMFTCPEEFWNDAEKKGLVTYVEEPHHPDCPATDGMGCHCNGKEMVD